MKEINRSKRISRAMLFALFALLTLHAQHAQAQGEQALTPGKSSTPAQCSDNQLSLRNYGETIAMGPTRFIEFILTNTSSSPCTLEGYPRFELLNKYGRPAKGGLAANGTGFMGLYTVPPQPVTIEPGKTARFFVNYLARYDEAREKPCRRYRKVSATAPGMKRVFVQRFQSYAIEVCSGLEVSPVIVASGYD